MSTVPTPISMIVIIRVRARPILSPSRPNTNPPTGRAMNPTAKVAKEASTPRTGSAPGKKILGKMMAAAKP